MSQGEVWKLTVTMGRYDDGRPRREYFTIEADSRVEAERERAALIAELALLAGCLEVAGPAQRSRRHRG